jgi:hypothetical protein
VKAVERFEPPENQTMAEPVGEGKAFELIALASLPEPEPRTYAVNPWLPHGAVSSLFGPGGVMKSYLALSIALHVAAGRDFAGMPVTGGPALFVDAELDAIELRRRAGRLARGMGLPSIPANLFYVKLGGTLRDPARIAALAEHVRQVQPALLVVDSWEFSFLPPNNLEGKHSPSEAVVAVRDLLALGPPVLAVDHVAKLGAATADSPFGSAYKLNAVRSALRVFPGEHGTLVIEQVKASFSVPAEPVALRFTFEADTEAEGEVVHSIRLERIDVADADLSSAKGGALTAGARILERLQLAGAPLSVREIAADLDLSESIARSRLNDLRRKGKATRAGKGWTA